MISHGRISFLGFLCRKVNQNYVIRSEPKVMLSYDSKPIITASRFGSNWTRRSWLGACALSSSLFAEQPSHTPIRVLLVTGGHDHEPSFYSVFEGQPEMSVNVDPHPGAFRGDPRERYDVIVLYDFVQVDQIEEARRRNLQQFVESGKGLVVLHHALCNYNSWEWWWRDVAGVRYLQRAEGNRAASTYKHDERLRITPSGSHPVLRGVEAIEITDETYKGLWLAPSNKVLLTTDNPTSDGPLAWISAYDKSRVVVIQPRHGREVHLSPRYRRVVRNAVVWSAGQST
jgi:type 1 glutamine amidotransferase